MSSGRSSPRASANASQNAWHVRQPLDRNASSVRWRGPTIDDVHRVVAQARAVDVGGRREAIRGARRAGRPDARTRRGIVRVEPRAERVQAPQDLGVAAQQAGDEQREQHEHDDFDRQQLPSSRRTLLHCARESRAVPRSTSMASFTQHATSDDEQRAGDRVVRRARRAATGRSRRRARSRRRPTSTTTCAGETVRVGRAEARARCGRARAAAAATRTR